MICQVWHGVCLKDCAKGLWHKELGRKNPAKIAVSPYAPSTYVKTLQQILCRQGVRFPSNLCYLFKHTPPPSGVYVNRPIARVGSIQEYTVDSPNWFNHASHYLPTSNHTINHAPHIAIPINVMVSPSSIWNSRLFHNSQKNFLIVSCELFQSRAIHHNNRLILPTIAQHTALSRFQSCRLSRCMNHKVDR